VSSPARYTPFHPRWYRKRVSVWWWLEKRTYAWFVLRELTSVFVALAALLFLWQVRSVTQGPEAYARFLARTGKTPFLVLSAIAFVFVLFHSITWINLAPKAMVMRVRGKRVPDWAVAGSNYLAWVVLSAGVAFFLLRG
jgi:fumarate reductase subunit C